MRITEAEARARLTSKDNLLARLGISTSDPSQPTPNEPEVSKVKYPVETYTEPTISSEGDPERLAVLAERRALTDPGSRGGRYPEQKNVPPIFRSLIGSAARLGTTRGAAKAFGVSHQLAHNYKHGKIAATDEPDPDLLSKIERDTLAIRNQVLGVLAFTVAGITPESIENKDPKELSIIARNLSSIMTSTKPPADFGDKTTNAQVIVFSPEQGGEEDYGRVDIG